MKVAYIMQCHKNPMQINLLIKTLNGVDCDFYLHIDKKSNIKSQINILDNVYFIDDEKRIDVKWGQISQINATLLLIDAVIKSGNYYDFIWLISGQDFPIKSQKYISEFLSNNKEFNFIEVIDNKDKIYNRYYKRNSLYYPKWIVNNNIFIKVIKKLYIVFTGGYNNTLWFNRNNTTGLTLYYGSSWWTLTYDCILYINNFVHKHPEIISFYNNSICPDESFFQTIIMNSKYRKTQKNYLTYVDWSKGRRSPKTLTVNDYDRLVESEALLARKFDVNEDNKIVEMINSYIHKS